MEIVYVSKDLKMYGKRLFDSAMPVGYIAAWVSPDEYEATPEEKRHMWMTLWIEAAAVGADPNWLTLETRGTLWIGSGGISTTPEHIDSYARAIGARVFKTKPNDDGWCMCWEGLPNSEMFAVANVRHGVMGALARFAWQDPNGWLAHVVGDVSPGRIHRGIRHVAVEMFDASLRDVDWWPPGEEMGKRRWSLQGATLTESETRCERDGEAIKERWMSLTDERPDSVKERAIKRAFTTRMGPEDIRGASRRPIVIDDDFKLLPDETPPVLTSVDERHERDYTAVMEMRTGPDDTIVVERVTYHGADDKMVVGTPDGPGTTGLSRDMSGRAEKENERIPAEWHWSGLPKHSK